MNTKTQTFFLQTVKVKDYFISLYVRNYINKHVINKVRCFKKYNSSRELKIITDRQLNRQQKLTELDATDDVTLHT